MSTEPLRAYAHAQHGPNPLRSCSAPVLASLLLFSRLCVAPHLRSASVPHSTSLCTRLCVARSKGPVQHLGGRFLFVVLTPVCSMVQLPVAFLVAPAPLASQHNSPIAFSAHPVTNAPTMRRMPIYVRRVPVVESLSYIVAL
ncbi:hypothetical protein LguiB_012641 [Lonicera macranthoides]